MVLTKELKEGENKNEKIIMCYIVASDDDTNEVFATAPLTNFMEENALTEMVNEAVLDEMQEYLMNILYIQVAFRR